MPDRITTLVTRTGDDGSTGLGDGTRRSKSDTRVVALGEVDELNATLGCLIAVLNTLIDTLAPGGANDELVALRAQLDDVQHDLFDLGAELCIPEHRALRLPQLLRLETTITRDLSKLTPLREFILPGGCMAAAQAHVCRTVCRRAERAVVLLGEHELLGDLPSRYLNRLSDWLFVVARLLNQAVDVPDVFWRPKRYDANPGYDDTNPGTVSTP